MTAPVAAPVRPRLVRPPVCRGIAVLVGASVLRQPLGEAGLAVVELVPADAAPGEAPAELAERMVAALEALQCEREAEGLGLGVVADGFAAAGAVLAAVEMPHVVQALALMSPRVDGAASALPEVIAPTLVLVASRDLPSARVAQAAVARMRQAVSRLVMIRRGTRDAFVRDAGEQVRSWLLAHLRSEPHRPQPPPALRDPPWSERLF